MATFNNPRKTAVTATASATLARGFHTPVNATSGPLTMTLPTTAPAGVEISVEKVDASSNAVNISGTIRGAASSIPLTSQYEVRTFLSEGNGSWRPTSDHRTAASLSATYAPVGQTLATMPPVWFCAHRGGSLLGPEHTMELYRMVADGGYAIEAADVRTLGDGTLVGLHDATADRTMTITGDVSTLSAPKWLAAKVKASSIPGGAGAWSDLSPVTMAQIAAEFAGGPLLVPNPVTVPQVNQLIDMFTRYGVNRDRVIVACGGGLTLAQAARARGWHASMDATDPAVHVANGIDWVTGDVNSYTQAQVDACKAAGLKVMLYTAVRRSEVSAFNGVDAWYSDDPWYVSGDTRWERQRDAFALGTWIPGMIPPATWTSLSSPPRGKFYTDGSWGFDINGGAINLIGHFYLAPTDPSSYTFDVQLQVDAVNGSDMTRGGYVYLGKSDKKFTDQTPTSFDGPDGYNIWLRADGTVNVYRKDYTTGHTSTVLAGGANIGAAMTLGTPVTYRITVSPTQITVARTGTGAGTAVTVTDSTYRGLRYISAGQVGAGVRFKNLVVS